MLATVIIPVSEPHREMGIYKEAIQSVLAQSLPTEYRVIFDTKRRGAAWARNFGTAQVRTPFVVYLDADDLLHPEFVERCVQQYRAGSYVYTDWQLHGKTYITPDRLNTLEAGMQHVITTLLPRVAWQDSKGFDERFRVLEDEDFYMKLAAYGWCGQRCPQALVTYRRERGFSGVNKETNDQDVIDRNRAAAYRKFKQRYERFKMLNHCGKRERELEIVNQRENNDVLCEALYSPCKEVGPATKRLYPRAGLRQPIWIDIEDAKARPDLWRRIASNPQKISPDVERVMELYRRAKQEARPPALWSVPSQALNVNGAKYEDMPMKELWRIVKKRDLSPCPTGKSGRYKKADLLAVLS